MDCRRCECNILDDDVIMIDDCDIRAMICWDCYNDYCVRFSDALCDIEVYDVVIDYLIKNRDNALSQSENLEFVRINARNAAILQSKLRIDVFKWLRAGNGE